MGSSHPATATSTCRRRAALLGRPQRSRDRRLGIEPRTTRLAALTQLASEIPPAILANAIGINARTATQWATTTGGDWAAYAAP